MIMNKIVLLIFIFNVVFISDSSSFKLEERENNTFHLVNGILQNAINKIFTMLQLNKNFTSDYKNRLLLTMHATMKSIAERNFKVYGSVKRFARLNTKRKPKAGLFDLEKLIDILVVEKLMPDNKTLQSNQTKKTGINLKFTSIEIPDKSEESITFLREYLYNIEDAELFDIDSPVEKIKDLFEKNKEKRKRNLKKWQTPNDTFETNVTETRRLYQGTGVKIKKYPFMASIHVMGDFVCAGTIISRDMVITAATCLQVAFNNKKFIHDNPDGVSIRVGSDYTHRFGDIYTVVKIFFHPSYDPVTLKNNLAIIKIKKRLHFHKKNKKIRRIEYHRIEREVPDSIHDIILLGWGDKDAQASRGFDPLSFSHLNIYNTTRCAQIYSRNMVTCSVIDCCATQRNNPEKYSFHSKYVTDENFCAGFTSKGSGACQRDVGGPGVVGNILYGVVSFGPPVCGAPDAPTVLENVAYHIDWINSVIKGIPLQLPVTRSFTSTRTTTTEIPISTPTRQRKSEHNAKILSQLNLKVNPNIDTKTNHKEDPKNNPKNHLNPKINFKTNQNIEINAKRNPKPNSISKPTTIKINKYKAHSTTPLNKGFPLRMPRAQYPKAIKVLTYLLNELLASGQNLDDIMYEDDKEDGKDDSSDNGIVVDMGGTGDKNENNDQEETVPKNIQTNAVKINMPIETTIQNDSAAQGNNKTEIYEEFSTPAVAQENSKDTSVSVSIINDVLNEMSHMVKKNSNISPEAEDPFYTAINSLKKYLGLSMTTNSKEELEETTETTNANANRHTTNKTSQHPIPHSYTTASNEIRTRAMLDFYKPNFDMIMNRVGEMESKSSDPNSSDNYESESEEGMSIEVPSGIPFIRSLTNAPQTTAIAWAARHKTQINSSILQDKARQFLSKNFVVDNNAPVRKNVTNDELVVLLQKRTSKMKPKIKNTSQTTTHTTKNKHHVKKNIIESTSRIVNPNENTQTYSRNDIYLITRGVTLLMPKNAEVGQNPSQNFNDKPSEKKQLRVNLEETKTEDDHNDNFPSFSTSDAITTPTAIPTIQSTVESRITMGYYQLSDEDESVENDTGRRILDYINIF